MITPPPEESPESADEPAIPENAPPPRLISTLLVAQLRALDEELEATLPRILRGRGEELDTEGIHDMRVAVRRIRTTLKLARPVFGRFWVDYVRAAFTVIHRSSGALRDEEVLGETLASQGRMPTALRAWRERRKQRERILRRTLVASIRKGAIEHARHLLDALLTLPVHPSADVEQTKFAERAVHRATKRVLDRQGTDTADVAGLHALRIAYKEVRYAVEVLKEALPPELRALQKPAATYQKRLGEIHDFDTALVAISRARGLDVNTRTRVLAALKRGRAASVEKYLKEGRVDVPRSAEASPQSHSAEASHLP